jgi:hypothetical protein
MWKHFFAGVRTLGLSLWLCHLSCIYIGKVWGDIPRDIARNIPPYLLILVNRNDPISAAQGHQGKLRP